MDNKDTGIGLTNVEKQKKSHQVHEALKIWTLPIALSTHLQLCRLIISFKTTEDIVKGKNHD